MKKVTLDNYRTDRMIDLMSEFFEYDNKFRVAVNRGDSFIDCHEWQIHASNVIHTLNEEGLLSKAKEMYSWEAPTINEYLEIYNEIKAGVRI